MGIRDRLRRRADGAEAPVAGPAATSGAAVPPGVGSAAPGPDPDLAHAERLAAAGSLVEAVDALATANRARRDPDLDVALVDLRHEAARLLTPGPGRADWPPRYDDPFPEVSGRVPEAEAGRLSTELLGGAVTHHGALMVRGVFSPEQVARSVEAIERTHERQQVTAPVGGGGSEESGDGAWYRPFPTDYHNETLRRMVARQGGTWLADSPSSTARVLEELETAGVTGAITGHLGERPYFSLQKSTLRRSLPTYNLVAWHQDGSFLDEDVRTMNVWVALSPCGGDLPSPGLEVVPKRMPGILPVDGVMSTHSISYDLVDEIAAETPTVIPEFAPGDAIIFDERFLHRTHLTDSMTEIRYALECWFFAPSHQASTYIPLMV